MHIEKQVQRNTYTITENHHTPESHKHEGIRRIVKKQNAQNKHKDSIDTIWQKLKRK